jgi:CRISPR-associated protein Cmx8
MDKLELVYDFCALPSAFVKAGAAGLVMAAKAFDIVDCFEISPNRLVARFTRTAFVKFMSYIFQQGQSRDRDGKVLLDKDDNPKVVPALPYFLKLMGGKAAGQFWVDRWQKTYRILYGFKQLEAFADYRGKAKRDRKAEYNKLFDSLQVTTDKKGNRPTADTLGRRVFWTDSCTAELQPIRGHVQEDFLLDFALIPCMTFDVKVPEWDAGKNHWQEKYQGQAIIVPEPSNLKSFVKDFLDVLKQIQDEKEKPESLVGRVVLPTQAALEYLGSFVHHRLKKSPETSEQLSAVYVLHVKRGTNVCNYLSMDHVMLNRAVIDQYYLLRGALWNPMLKRAVLTSLLENEPWYSRLGEVLVQHPLRAYRGNFGHDIHHLLTRRIT